MRKLSEALYSILLTLWIGGLWAIGYLAVPVLFASLGNRQLAGLVAGKLFTLIGWIGLACATGLLLLLAWRWRRAVLRQTACWLVLGMVTLTLIGLFGIQPLLAQLKADVWPQDVMASALRERFVFWHGVSSLFYLLQSLLGLGLAASGRDCRCQP
jgi:hypothetical protein